MSEFVLGESVIVSERDYHRGTITKIARRYLTVQSSYRSWEFDKETRSCRGDHCGYIPHLLTLSEYEHLKAWQELYDAWCAMPHLGSGVATEALKTALVALRACNPKRQ
jgi:hypothetical protein